MTSSSTWLHDLNLVQCDREVTGASHNINMSERQERKQKSTLNATLCLKSSRMVFINVKSEMWQTSWRLEWNYCEINMTNISTDDHCCFSDVDIEPSASHHDAVEQNYKYWIDKKGSKTFQFSVSLRKENINHKIQSIWGHLMADGNSNRESLQIDQNFDEKQMTYLR